MSVAEHSPKSPVAVAAPQRSLTKRRHGMSVSEAFRVALQGLVANKMRSFLTMLGIIIGVGSVIVMVALGQGVANATQESIRKMGTNVLSVWPNAQNTKGVSQGLGSQQTMKIEDVDIVRKQCPSVKAVSPEVSRQGTVKFQNQNTKTSIVGAGPVYFEIKNLPISQGHGFTEQDVKRKAKVAVIGDTVRDTLFGGLQPVGKYVKVNGQNFLVKGVVAKRGSTGWRSPDDQITIPISTAMQRVFGVQSL